MVGVYGWGFPGHSNGKESACNVGNPGLIPGWGRSSGEGNGKPLQCSCLEKSMDRRAGWATVHGVEKSWTWLSDITIIITGVNSGPGGKESACQCRRCRSHGFDPWVGKIPWRRKWKPTPVVLAWRIPWTEEPVGYSPWGHRESHTTRPRAQAEKRLSNIANILKWKGKWSRSVVSDSLGPCEL